MFARNDRDPALEYLAFLFCFLLWVQEELICFNEYGTKSHHLISRIRYEYHSFIAYCHGAA